MWRWFMHSCLVSCVWLYIWGGVWVVRREPAPPPEPRARAHSRFLPLALWQHRARYPARYTRHACATLPPLSALDHAAPFWQRVGYRNHSLFAYSAYWDGYAPHSSDVRIIVYSVQRLHEMYCQLWFFDDNVPETSRAELMPDVLVARSTAAAAPAVWVVSCATRRAHPAAVSLALRPCEQTANVLAVQHPDDEGRTSAGDHSVAVCVMLHSAQEDYSAMLLIWIELLLELGADVIYMYSGEISKEMMHVMQYYAQRGTVLTSALVLPPVDRARGRRAPRLRALLGDCLLRAPRSAWLLPLALGELPLPHKHHSWKTLLKKEMSNGSYDALVIPGMNSGMGSSSKQDADHTYLFSGDQRSFQRIQSIRWTHGSTPACCARGACHLREAPRSEASLASLRAPSDARLLPWLRRIQHHVATLATKLNITIPTYF